MMENTPKRIRQAATLLTVAMVVFAGTPFTTSVSLSSNAAATTSTTTVQDQDLTTYNEHDPNNEISTTSNEITLNSLSATSGARLYKQINTSNHNVTVEFNFNFTSQTQYARWRMGFGSKADTTDSNMPDFVGLYYGEFGGTNEFRLADSASGSSNKLVSKINLDTTYYVTFELNRKSGQATAKLYSDSGRTNQVGSATITYDQFEELNQFYATLGDNQGSGGDLSGTVSDVNVTLGSSYTSSVDEQNTSDFTTFNHTKPNNAVLINDTNQLEIDNAKSTYTDRVAKEIGPNVGNASFSFDFEVSESTQYGTLFVGYAKRDDTPYNQETAGVFIKNSGGLKLIAEGTTVASLSHNKRYFVNTTYNAMAAELTVKLYSDKERTNQLASKTVTYKSTVNYSHVVIGSRGDNAGSPGSMDAQIENFKQSTSGVKSPNSDLSGNVFNLNTFNQTDPDDTIAITGKKQMLFSQLDHEDKHRLFTPVSTKDNGNLTMRYNIKVTSKSGYGRYLTGFSTKKNITYGDAYNNGHRTLTVTWAARNGNGPKIRIKNQSGTPKEVASVSVDTRYFISYTLDFGDGVAHAEVYSDRNRTNLVGEQTLSFDPSPSYDYFYAAMGQDLSSSSPGGLSGNARDFRTQSNVKKVSGRVVYCPESNPGCENPSGVPNGTVVEAYGVKTTNIDPGKAQTLRERAEEIRNSIREFDPEKIGWEPNLELTGDTGKFSNLDENYVAIHTESQWGLSGWSDTPDLGDPMLTAPADQSFIVSVWNPTHNPWPQDGVDDDLPGTVQDDTRIVFKQLDYQGTVVNTYRVETHSTYDVSGFGGSHDFARVNLPTGFYRVSAEGSSFSYVMTVGNPEDLTRLINQDLKAEAEQKASKLTDRAKRIQNLINDNRVVELTTTTYTENGTRGKFNFTNVPSDVKVVAIQAYTPSLEKYQIEDPANASLQSLREVAALDTYNSSFYVTPRAKDVRVPTTDARIKALEMGGSPFMDPSRYANRTAWLKDLLQNSTFADQMASYMNMTRENVTELRNRFQNLTEQNQQLRERYQELLEQRAGTDPSTREELRALRQAVRDLQGQLKAEDPSTDYSDGTVSATIPWNGDVDTSAVTVVANYPGLGTSEPVPTEYVSVNKRTGRGDVVHVTDYPIPDGANMVTFGVTVSGEDGQGIGNTKVRATDPSFTGKLLNLKSVDISTMQPGPNEQVSISLNPSDTSAQIQSVNATVDGPNGEVAVSHGETNDVVQFTTNGAGTYYTTLKITTTNGQTYTETLAIPALDENVDGPPSVRVRQGYTGTFAIVGDGLTGGVVKTEGVTLTSTAIAPADNVPRTVHFYASEVSGTHPTVNLAIMQDTGTGTPSSVRQHVTVNYHTTKLSDDAVVYRGPAGFGGDPLKVGGETAYGSINCPENKSGCTISTYTDGTGEVRLTVLNNPSVLDKAIHWVQLKIDFNVPSIPFAGAISPGSIGNIATAGWVDLPTLDVGQVAVVAEPVERAVTPLVDSAATVGGAAL